MKIDWDEFERTRGEFRVEDSIMERSDQEHPEQAYRRGVQQGAYFILEALEANRASIDPKFGRHQPLCPSHLVSLALQFSPTAATHSA
jgi:hypothetical protein